MTLKSSPRKIALGFALGVFLAFTPTFGVQTILTLSLAALLRVNPISATVGVYVSNPLTVVPMYALCYKLGAWILGVSPVIQGEELSWGLLSLGKTGLSWMGVEMVGAIFVGGVSAMVGYFVALASVVRYRRARLNRRIEKMRQRLEDTSESESDSRHEAD